MASFWLKIWNALAGPVATETVTGREESYLLKWTDPSTGKVHVYHSPDEVPAEVRARLAEAQGTGIGMTEYLVYRGRSGRRHAYSSRDEIPAAVRQDLEALRSGGAAAEDSAEVRTFDTDGRIRATVSGERLTIRYRRRQLFSSLLLVVGGLALAGLGVRWFLDPSMARWLGSLVVLGGLGGSYYGLQLLLNRTVIVITPSRFRVRNGPLPGLGVQSVSVPAHAVGRIECREIQTRYTYHSLWAHVKHRGDIKIIAELASSADGPILKKLIEGRLRGNERGRGQEETGIP